MLRTFIANSYYFISIIYSSLYFLFYYIFVFNNHPITFMDLAACIVLTEPFLCFKLLKKHREIIEDMNKDINHYGNETIIDDARYEWEQETGMFTGGSGREGGHEDMDGDFDSAMASAGHGTDEDYGYYGETAGNQMRKYADIISESNKIIKRKKRS